MIAGVSEMSSGASAACEVNDKTNADFHGRWFSYM